MKCEWTKTTASNFCTKVTDGTHDSPKAQSQGRKLITSKHLKGHYIDFENAYWISDTDYQKIIERSKVEQWDILYSMIGTIGSTYIETNNTVEYACKNMGIFKFGGNKQKALWMFYYLKSPMVTKYIHANLRGSTQSYVPLVALRDLPIFVPSEEERDKIVSILRLLDDKIAVNQQINDNLQQQVAAIYKSWYQDFDTANKAELIETEYGMIPQGWHYALLGDLCQSVSVTHRFDKEELVFLNTGDVENGRFLHSKLMAVKDMPGQAKKSIAPGDILYSEIRPVNRHFAFVSFPSADYVVSTKLMVIRAKSIDARRLYHYLTSEDVLSELQLQAESRSGTFPQIRFDNVSRLPILIADEQTECAFVEILHTVYEQIEQINCENEKLAELRDTLLPRLMSGEIDVAAVQD